MKKFILNFLLLTVPSIIIILLLFELVFRFVIPAANKPDLYFDQKEQLIHFNNSTNTTGLYTAGKFAQQKGRWSVNNYGWNSPVNYQPKKDGKLRIAVIGDSFIEALMVDNTKTYPSLLAKVSPRPWEVYAFGISGAPLSQYLHMSRYVAKTFDPDVLVINIVYNDFDESLSDFKDKYYFKKLDVGANNSVKETTPMPYKLTFDKKLIKRSALMRYFYINLQLRYTLDELFKDKSTKNVNANVSVDPIYAQRDKINVAVNYMFNKFRTENPGKKIVLVMDGPRFDIYDNKLSTSNVLFLNQMVARSAAANHLDFIDLTNVFASDFKKNHKRFNSNFDSHWDEYGHKLVADTLYKFIKTHYYPQP